MATWLVVGLGNPGREYEDTRHNVGFRVLDLLASSWGFRFKGPRHEAMFAECEEIPGRKRDGVVWVKPLTYMNLSGRSIKAFAAEYEVKPERVLIVADDLNLPLGKLRIRQKGSTGGHNGLESTERALGTRDYPRLRVGIGRPTGRRDPADWVLEPYRKDEQIEADIAEQNAKDAVERCLVKGVVIAMNEFNRSEPDSDKEAGDGQPSEKGPEDGSKKK